MSLLNELGAETRLQIDNKASEVIASTDTKIQDTKDYSDLKDSEMFNGLDARILSLDNLKASKAELQIEADNLTAYIDAADDVLTTSKMDVAVAETKLQDLRTYINGIDAILTADKASKVELEAVVTSLTNKVNTDINELSNRMLQLNSDLDEKNLDTTEFLIQMNDEIQVRTEEDQELNTRLDNEIGRSTLADENNEAKIVAEEIRAIQAEANILNRLNDFIQNFIDTKADLTYVNEQVQRIDGENNLQAIQIRSLVDTKVDKVTYNTEMLNMDNQKLDKVDFQAEKLILEGEIDRLDASDTQINQAIQNEVDTRELKDGNLVFDSLLNKTDISNNIVTPKNLTDAINTEARRANESEGTIQLDLDNFKVQNALVETALDNKITALRDTSELADEALNTKIVQETLDREAHDVAITDSINDLELSLLQENEARKLDIANEKSRAIAEETILNTKINNEITRSTNEEINLANLIELESTTRQNSIDNVTLSLNNEITRSTNEDASIRTVIEGNKLASENKDDELHAELTSVGAALVLETQTRESENLILSGRVTVEKNRIDGILAASSADLDSFAEMVNLINNIDQENDDAFASYVSTNNARSVIIEDSFAQEIIDRTAADSLQDLTIAENEEASLSRDSFLQENIDATNANLLIESQTRYDSLNEIQGNLDAETTNRINEIETLNTFINQETTERSNNDNIIQGNLDDEISTREANDGTLNFVQSLNDENGYAPTNLTDAVNKTNMVLTETITELDNEVSEFKSDNQNSLVLLDNIITEETTNRTNQDTILNAKIDTVESGLEAKITINENTLNSLGSTLSQTSTTLDEKINQEIERSTFKDNELTVRLAIEEDARAADIQDINLRLESNIGLIVEPTFYYKNIWDLDLWGQNIWYELDTFLLVPGVYQIKMDSSTTDNVQEGSQFGAFIDGIDINGGQLINDRISTGVWTNICSLEKGYDEKAGIRNFGSAEFYVRVEQNTTIRFNARPIRSNKSDVEIKNRTIIYKLADI